MAAPSAPFPLQLDTIKFGSEELYRLLDNIAAEGVIGSGDGAVTQFGTGEMRVNVAAGEAVCGFETPYGGKRQLLWTATSSGLPGSPNTGDNWLSTFAAAHGTLPRIDRVVATVQDAGLDATGQRRQVFQVIGGTATAGADLTNLNGAASIPANSILFANVLVRAAATTILTADIDTAISTVRPQATLGGRLLPGGGMTRIDEVLLTGATATLDFQNIPATFRHLQLIVSARGTAALTGVTVTIRFNNDSGANYDFQHFTYTSAGNPTQTQLFAQSSGLLGDAVASTARASRFTPFDILIPDYANTSREKAYQCESGFAWGVAQSHNADGRGAWRSVAAINRVTLLISAGGGNFDVGSRATLYGVA